jgi:hypothetical protein
MTQGGAQQRGRQIGTTAALPLDSDSAPQLFSLSLYSHFHGYATLALHFMQKSINK